MFQTTNKMFMAFMGFLASHFWRPGTIPESLGLGGHARLLRVHGKCPKIIWLVVWNMNLIFVNHKYMINIWKYMDNIWNCMTFHILGISSSQLTFTPSFFRGVGIPPTSYAWFIRDFFVTTGPWSPNWGKHFSKFSRLWTFLAQLWWHHTRDQKRNFKMTGIVRTSSFDTFAG